MPFKSAGSGKLNIIPVVGTQSAPNNVLDQSFFRRQGPDGIPRYASLDPTTTQLGTRAIAQLSGGLAIGADSLSIDQGSVAVGVRSISQGLGSIAIGNEASALLRRGIAIGFQTSSESVNSIVIGANSLAIHPNSIVIGNDLKSTAANIIRIGPNLSLVSGNWLIQNEVATDPPAPDLEPSQTKFALYMKNNKFVISYNLGGVQQFISIPMDGSTTTWTHNTTAP